MENRHSLESRSEMLVWKGLADVNHYKSILKPDLLYHQQPLCYICYKLLPEDLSGLQLKTLSDLARSFVSFLSVGE